MTINTSTAQTISFEGDAVVSLDRWTGGVTMRSGDDSVSLRSGSREALEIAVRSFLSGGRYVQEEDAAAMVAYLTTVVETATSSIRQLQERFPQLEPTESGVTG